MWKYILFWIKKTCIAANDISYLFPYSEYYLTKKKHFLEFVFNDGDIKRYDLALSRYCLFYRNTFWIYPSLNMIIPDEQGNLVEFGRVDLLEHFHFLHILECRCSAFSVDFLLSLPLYCILSPFFWHFCVFPEVACGIPICNINPHISFSSSTASISPWHSA